MGKKWTPVPQNIHAGKEVRGFIDDLSHNQQWRTSLRGQRNATPPKRSSSPQDPSRVRNGSPGRPPHLSGGTHRSRASSPPQQERKKPRSPSFFDRDLPAAPIPVRPTVAPPAPPGPIGKLAAPTRTTRPPTISYEPPPGREAPPQAADHASPDSLQQMVLGLQRELGIERARRENVERQLLKATSDAVSASSAELLEATGTLEARVQQELTAREATEHQVHGLNIQLSLVQKQLQHAKLEIDLKEEQAAELQSLLEDTTHHSDQQAESADERDRILLATAALREQSMVLAARLHERVAVPSVLDGSGIVQQPASLVIADVTAVLKRISTAISQTEFSSAPSADGTPTHRQDGDLLKAQRSSSPERLSKERVSAVELYSAVQGESVPEAAAVNSRSESLSTLSASPMFSPPDLVSPPSDGKRWQQASVVEPFAHPRGKLPDVPSLPRDKSSPACPKSSPHSRRGMTEKGEAAVLQADRMRMLQTVFSLLDVEGVGAIQVKELLQLGKSYSGLQPGFWDELQNQQLVALMTANSDSGLVSAEQFCTRFEQALSAEPVEWNQVINQFMQVAHEFRQSRQQCELEVHHQPGTAAEQMAARVMLAADQHATNQRLSVNELRTFLAHEPFTQWLTGGRGAGRGKMTKYDTDKDGAIDLNELTQACADYLAESGHNAAEESTPKHPKADTSEPRTQTTANAAVVTKQQDETPQLPGKVRANEEWNRMISEHQQPEEEKPASAAVVTKQQDERQNSHNPPAPHPSPHWPLPSPKHASPAAARLAVPDALVAASQLAAELPPAEREKYVSRFVRLLADESGSTVQVEHFLAVWRQGGAAAQMLPAAADGSGSRSCLTVEELKKELMQSLPGSKTEFMNVASALCGAASQRRGMMFSGGCEINKELQLKYQRQKEKHQEITVQEEAPVVQQMTVQVPPEAVQVLGAAVEEAARLKAEAEAEAKQIRDAALVEVAAQRKVAAEERADAQRCEVQAFNARAAAEKALQELEDKQAAAVARAAAQAAATEEGATKQRAEAAGAEAAAEAEAVAEAVAEQHAAALATAQINVPDAHAFLQHSPSPYARTAGAVDSDSNSVADQKRQEAQQQLQQAQQQLQQARDEMEQAMASHDADRVQAAAEELLRRTQILKGIPDDSTHSVNFFSFGEEKPSQNYINFSSRKGGTRPNTVDSAAAKDQGPEAAPDQQTSAPVRNMEAFDTEQSPPATAAGRQAAKQVSHGVAAASDGIFARAAAASAATTAEASGGSATEKKEARRAKMNKLKSLAENADKESSALADQVRQAEDAAKAAKAKIAEAQAKTEAELAAAAAVVRTPSPRRPSKQHESTVHPPVVEAQLHQAAVEAHGSLDRELKLVFSQVDTENSGFAARLELECELAMMVPEYPDVEGMLEILETEGAIVIGRPEYLGYCKRVADATTIAPESILSPNSMAQELGF